MKLNEIIKEEINSILNERVDINSIPQNIVMLSTIINENTIFLLYDVNQKIPIGYIGFELYPTINSYTVGGAYAEHGYGAFLYESAMTHLYPNGLSMSRDANTSGDALDVWVKFDERNDVRKEKMNSNELTHKKEDLPNSGIYDDEPEELKKILELEDTRFYYNYGKDKLSRLIKIGNEYQRINNITDEKINYMTWDLEGRL